MLYYEISLQVKKKENVKIANTIFLQEADKKLNGIRDFLDPLQFYREDISPEDELREKLSNLKYGIESKTPVKKKKKRKGKRKKRNLYSFYILLNWNFGSKI